jgi:hypothetical protein
MAATDASAPPATRRRGQPRGIRITDRDLELLAFTADHRLVLAAHIQALLDISAPAANRRLRTLSAAGLLHEETGLRFRHQPAFYQVTRRGLAVLGSGFRPPNVDVSCYAHDVGLAWLWLAARAGTFGLLREVLSERQLRSRDARPDREGEPLGVRLGGFGPRGRERLHYPDLLLHTASAHRVALELELSGKNRARRETILAGYAADARIDAVLYLVNRSSVGRDIRASAAKLGISSLVHVQNFVWGDSMQAFDRAPARERARALQRSAQVAR